MNALEAEKLLRRIEVKRLFEQPDHSFTLEEIQQFSIAFMHLSLDTEDWRYLNTALKLNDWLRANSHFPGELSCLEDEALSALRISCGLAARQS